MHEALAERGFHAQASRLIACRKYSRCRLYRICDGCAGRRAGGFAAEMVSDMRLLRERHDRQAAGLVSVAGALESLQGRPDEMFGRSPRKDSRALRSVLKHQEESVALLCQEGLLYRSYRPQALTVTRKTDPELPPQAYRRLVGDTFQKLRQALKSGFLHSSGAGAVVGLHLQDNLNLHAVYLGPPITDIESMWYEATGDSNQAHVQTLADDQHLSRWSSYMLRLPPEVHATDLVERWLAIRGCKSMRRYGTFRRGDM